MPRPRTPRYVISSIQIATNDPAFYNNTIRNLAAPWTNRDQTVFAALNDYVATVVGMVRGGDLRRKTGGENNDKGDRYTLHGRKPFRGGTFALSSRARERPAERSGHPGGTPAR